ncbi:MAG TPA: hypothetical protein VI636_04300 [Candidatus Angelobacter sp.]
MKNTIVRIVLAWSLLLACGSTPSVADGGVPPPPWCPPGGICN